MNTTQLAMVALLGFSSLTIPVAALQQDQTVHKIGGDVTAPRLIHKVEPEYTEEARDAKIEGTCLLTLVIDQEGLPQDIKIERSLDAGLDLNAIAAVRRWRFSPGEKAGKPVRVAAKIEVNFKLL